MHPTHPTTHEARHATEVGFAGRYHLPAAAPEVWRHLERLESFGRWWGWLSDLEASGARLAAGVELRGTVRPPVPYPMRVTVRLDDVVPGRRIGATVGGDLEGPARLTLHDCRDGCDVAVAWRVEMRRPAMRAASRLARPVLLWGHDRVVEHTVERFRAEIGTRR